MKWELDPGAASDNAHIPGVTLYLWGFLVVFTAALILGGWAWGRARRSDTDTLWHYFVMALLWPLFVCAVLFLILWTVLTKSHRNN